MISSDNTQHFVLIKDLDALLRTKNKYGKTVHCNRCLQAFTTTALRAKHVLDCDKFAAQATDMPKERRMKFDSQLYAWVHYTLVLTTGN